MLDEDGFLPAVEYFLPYSSGVEDAQGRRVGGAVLVSYEWPSEDFSRQESRYLDDDVPWHPQIEVGKASSLVVVSPVAPFNCEFWVYSKRDREGIPIGEPVDSGSCRYSFKSGDAGILNVAIPEIYSSASLAVLQLEWSGLFETAPDRIFSARMSWAVQFE